MIENTRKLFTQKIKYMQIENITIIGGGNLGGAMAQGLVKTKMIPAQRIFVTRRRLEKIAYLEHQGVNTLSDNHEAAAQADIVILAVKPNTLNAILQEIKPVLEKNQPVLVSLVTGVTLNDIQALIGQEIPLFRAMPNTAIAIQESMTCISTNNTNEAQKAAILNLFDHLGRSVIIQDELMAAATVLGACGVAYSMRYIRAASQGGIEIGFDAQTAQLIAAQMVKGSAALLLENGNHPEQEIDKVTTPQGCTIAGLNEMEHQGFSSALIKGILSSYHKINDIREDYRD